MDVLIDLSWRVYPATALMVAGGLLAVRGLRGMGDPGRRALDLLAWLRAFRLAVIGLALAGIGAAWLWHLPWLLAIAVGVGAEETLESSSYIAVLHGYRRQTAATARDRPPGESLGRYGHHPAHQRPA